MQENIKQRGKAKKRYLLVKFFGFQLQNDGSVVLDLLCCHLHNTDLLIYRTQCYITTARSQNCKILLKNATIVMSYLNTCAWIYPGSRDV